MPLPNALAALSEMLFTLSVPLDTVTAPLKVFAPDSVSVPVPALVSDEAAPARMEEIVSEELFTVITDALPRLMVPPDRLIAPEAEPKVKLPALTVPETVIVPAPRAAEEVPKFKSSEVVVLVVPVMVFVPADEVDHPWVELFVVGSAHVPVAVPKPEVEPLPSQ